MKELTLRKWHRWLAILVAPLLLLQAISGTILSIDWLLGFHQRIGEVLARTPPPWARIWDAVFVTIHYGSDVGGAVYHAALGIITVLVVIFGFMIFFKVRNRQKKAVVK
ncbi:hypothetical protein ACFLXH_03210 [Chloroflexota bacterium]